MKTRQYYRSWAPGVCLGLVLRLLVCLLALLCWNRSGWCAGFVVTNPNNAAEGSLRQAILEANQLPGPDNILFNIPGGGPHVLLITAPLPDIVDPVFINGYSQPGSKTNSLAAGNNAIVNIVLDGANVDGAGDGLRVAVSNCVVAGLHLRNHGGSAVVISNANNCALFGNFIGTPPSQGSGSHGISLEGAAFCSIGGLGRGDRNLISGNQEGGIRVWNSPTNRIAGNEIQNNSGPGIVLAGPASQGNLIDTNIISGNQVGILSRANAGGRNRFLGNRIFNNAGLGIDLNEDGVTPNDPDDSDSGPNGLQNAPELVLITAQDPLALVDGFLQSAPLTAYRLDFFSSPAPDLSLYGEGQTFIGAINIVTDSSGQFSFFIGLPVSPGDWVTATATSASGDTSEFSEAEIVGTAPTFAVQPRSQTVFAGDTVALSVRVGGISPFTFQWFRGETPLAGETNSFLVLPNIQPPDECYYVAVANVYGQTNSELACLTVQPRPLISQIPTSVFAPQGEAGMFCVTVESTGPVQYQWRLNGVNVQGATNACYDIPEVAVANQGVYYAVIIADEIPLISPRAFLTIPEIPRPAVRDDFADRLALMGMQGTIGGSSSNATREIGEPNHGGKSGSKSVWYS